jgi:hypothetical protein
MADLDDLNYTSITDMNNDEAIDLLRQIRLSRRTVKASPKKQSDKQVKEKVTSAIKPDMAVELLKLLEGIE